MNVSELNIYPLKSGRGIALPCVEVNLDGMAGDRRFMVVKPNGKFITQRELRLLAQIDAKHLESGDLQLKMQGNSLTATFNPTNRMTVEIWGTSVVAAVASFDVNTLLSDWLNQPVKLVHMDAQAVRFASTDWAMPNSPVAFADGFQVLITTTGSLRDLNQTMVEKGQPVVGMDRFRPNIVIEHDEPWEEDTWKSLDIGGVIFDLVKPCARCVMTTQDQVTGAQTGGNPMAGLSVKRLSNDRRVPGPLFGWNAVPRTKGTIARGQTVTVLALRSKRWAMKHR